MQWGPRAVSLKKLSEHGVESSAAMGPRLSQWTAEYYRAFQALNNSRTITMGGIGPIPLSEIKAYLDMLEITDLDDREYWVRMIRVLDAVYIDFMSKKVKRERDRQSKKGPRVGRKRAHR